MPEINPLTNNQIFLKKIAENTGSNYETGDVSEINPLTTDQIFLKEIAANTAGQSGDITELEGKVADNTSAISAMVNVNGCCNILPVGMSTLTDHGITLTLNTDGSITVPIAESSSSDGSYWVSSPRFTCLMSGIYVYKGCPSGGSDDTYIQWLRDVTDGINMPGDYGEGIQYTLTEGHLYESHLYVKKTTQQVIFYPMLYDDRLNPTGYVPYAMTNRELTKKVTQSVFVSVPTDGIKTQKQLMRDLYALVDASKITMQSKLVLNNANSLLFYSLEEQALDNRFICFMRTAVSIADGVVIETYQLGDNTAYAGKAYSGAEHETSSEVLSAGMSFTVFY